MDNFSSAFICGQLKLKLIYEINIRNNFDCINSMSCTYKRNVK